MFSDDPPNLDTSSEFLNMLRLDLSNHSIQDSLDRERFRKASSFGSCWEPPKTAESIADLFELHSVLDDEETKKESGESHNSFTNRSFELADDKEWTYTPSTEFFSHAEMKRKSDETMGRSLILSRRKEEDERARLARRRVLCTALQNVPKKVLKEFGHFDEEIEQEMVRRAEEEEDQHRNDSTKPKSTKKEERRRASLVHRGGGVVEYDTCVGEGVNVEHKSDLDDNDDNFLQQHGGADELVLSRQYTYPTSSNFRYGIEVDTVRGVQFATRMPPGYLSGSELSPRLRGQKEWERQERMSRARELRGEKMRDEKRREEERLEAKRRMLAVSDEEEKDEEAGEEDEELGAGGTEEAIVDERVASLRSVKKLSKIIRQMQSDVLESAAREAKPIVDRHAFKVRVRKPYTHCV
eukprot:g3123.t1